MRDITERSNPFRKVYDSDEFKNARLNTPSFPFLVDVELTNQCNLRCEFCSQNIMTRQKGYMDEDTFGKILEECVKHKTPMRFIRWGEPLLNPNILEYSRAVCESGLPLHITTNGLLLNKQHIDEFIDMGLSSIIFSMQGSTKREYERMRRNKEYDKLEQNVKNLVSSRGDKELPYVHVSSTMTKRDKPEMIETFKDKWTQIADSVGVGVTNMNRVNKLPPEQDRYQLCNEVYQKLSVDWNGKVTPCCADFDNLLTIGHINEGLEYLWLNSEKLKWIRRMLDSMEHRCFTLCSECYLAYGDFGNHISKKGK